MSDETHLNITTALLWGVGAIHLAFVLGYYAGSGETHGWPYGAALLSQIAANAIIVIARRGR